MSSHNDSKKNICSIRHLTVNYERMPALWDITTQLPAHNLIAVCGPNGAGKSTFLKALLGLIPYVTGQIDFDLIQQKGYMPQRQNVDWDFPLTVFELVLMGCYGRLGLFSRVPSQEKDKAYESIARVGLSGLEHRQISQLSGGQQGRAFLARALMQEAQIYFLDEPFAGIDTASSQLIMEILQELKQKEKTIVVVHHDLKEIHQMFDWAVLLNRRLVGAGPVEEVLTERLIQLAYGKENLLFDRAAQLTENTTQGYAL